MKFYVISFEDGSICWAEDADYISTLNHAEYLSEYESRGNFTIEEYESYDDYMRSI